MGKVPRKKFIWRTVVSLCVLNPSKTKTWSSLFELQKGFWLTPHENVVINSSCIYCWHIINNWVLWLLGYIRISVIWDNTSGTVLKYKSDIPIFWHTYFLTSKIQTKRNFSHSLWFLLLARGEENCGVSCLILPSWLLSVQFSPICIWTVSISTLWQWCPHPDPQKCQCAYLILWCSASAFDPRFWKPRHLSCYFLMNCRPWKKLRFDHPILL